MASASAWPRPTVRTSSSAAATAVAISFRPRPPIKPGSLTKEQFARVFERGLSRRFGPLTLRFAPGEGRLGYAITKKAETKPRRNRIKRRLVEATRAAAPDLTGHDWIVSAGLPCLALPFDALVAALRDAFAGCILPPESGVAEV